MFRQYPPPPIPEHPLLLQVDERPSRRAVAPGGCDSEPTRRLVQIPCRLIPADERVPVHATQRRRRVRDAELHRSLVPRLRGGNVLSNPTRGLKRRSSKVEQRGELGGRRGVARFGGFLEPLRRLAGTRAALGAVAVEPRASQVVARLGYPRLRGLRVGLHRHRLFRPADDAEAVHEAVAEVEGGARVPALGGEPERLGRVAEVPLRAGARGAADAPPVRAFQRPGFRAASKPVRTLPRILGDSAVAVHVYLAEQLHRVRLHLRHDLVALQRLPLVLRAAEPLAVAGGQVDEREGVTGGRRSFEPREGGGVIAGKLVALEVSGAQVAHRLRVPHLGLLAQHPHQGAPVSSGRG